MERRSISWLSLGLTMIVLVGFLAVPPSRAEGPLSGIKVCLDPGHGGLDPGAVNDDFELKESEINLDVSVALAALLAADGADVVMTRTNDDSYLENRDRYTFCNSERATILVSVHTNSTTDPTWDGSMGLYFNPDDKILAQAIHEVMYQSLKETAPVPDAFRDWGLSRFSSGVLMKSDMPAAMMEPLFMSNPAEADLLQESISDGCTDLSCRRVQIVQALYAGIRNYFDGNTPPPTPEPGGTLHVAAIDMWSAKKGTNVFVYTRVTIHDDHKNPVPGATVWLSTTQPDGTEVSDIDTTGEDGSATLTIRSRQTGTYSSVVTDVTKDGWGYDGAAAGVSLIVP